MKVAAEPQRANGLVLPQARHPSRRRWAVAPVAAARQKQKQPQRVQPAGDKGFGKPSTASPTNPLPEQPVVAAPDDTSAATTSQSGDTPALEASTIAGGEGAALPAVSRGRIFAVCAQVSVLVTALAFGVRQLAPAISPAVGDGQAEAVEALLNWSVLPTASQLVLSAAVAAGVTGARLALQAAWPDFREASERSNKQVLTPLGAADLVWVAALPAVSEELLFRGALIPAVYPDWRGMVIAGLAFGVLHNSGGRNPAFAAWASLVGCAYGALFLATGSVACPALAHALANLASAAVWKAAPTSDGDSA